MEIEAFGKAFIAACALFATLKVEVNSTGTKMAGDWTYEDPSMWHLKYPDCDPSKNNKQSPVEINLDELPEDCDYDNKALIFNNFCMVEGITIINDGRSVNVKFPIMPHSERDLSKVPHIMGGFKTIAEKKFMPISMQFHWPSEHSLITAELSMIFTLEVVINFIDLDSECDTLEEALTKKDGVCAVSILFDEHSVGLKRMKALFTLLDHFKNDAVKYPNHKGLKIEKPIDLDIWLPRDEAKYFHYTASSNRPPCGKDVHHYIFQSTVPTTMDVMDIFHDLQRKGDKEANQHCPFLCTRRPQQNTKCIVFSYFEKEDDSDESQ